MKYINLVKNIINWQDYLLVRWGFNKDRSINLKLRYAPLKLRMIPSMKPLFREIFLKEVYSPAFQHVKTENPVIIDVGGNMGYFAMYAFFKKSKAKIFSFEPVPTNFGFLTYHKETHPFLNWTIYNFAVSNKAGEFDFYYNSNFSPEGIDVSASLFPPDKISTIDTNHRKITVPVLSLNNWMKEKNISICDILKLDCEGAEYSIIYSMPNELLKGIKYIVADVHKMTGNDENIHSLSDYLTKRGFEVNIVNEELLYACNVSV